MSLHFMNLIKNKYFYPFAALFILVFLTAGCNPTTHLLNRIPVHSVEVQVLDHNDQPVPGAQVESSNGRQTTTDKDGMAIVRFGSVGIHSISVFADNYMPSNMIVTLPTDRGKMLTARLTDQINFSGFSLSSVQMYPLLFNYLFTSYGYNLALTDYDPGDWTKWAVHTGEESESLVMQKALLKKLNDGREWWQVIMYGDSKDEPMYVAEMLFSKDQTSIRRYREQFKDQEIQEKPVSEDWYTQPMNLTEESIEGATSERGVNVTVPSGEFTADLIDYGVVSGVSVKLWQVTGVPGGVVKYKNQTEEEVLYTSELVDYGNNAQSLLRSY